MRIVFAGGGTGGHFFPCLAVKRQLEKILKENNYKKEYRFVFFIAGKLNLFQEELERENIEYKKILEVKWRRYFTLKNFLDLLKLPLLFLQVFFYLWMIMPDLIFSKGGPSSWVINLCGRILFIPVILHESDVVPGLSNKFSAFLAKKILVSFEETKKFFPAKKTIFTGHPLREAFLTPPKDSKENFKIKSNRKVVLFLGGSQGAREINELLIDAIYKYLHYFEIVHICGPENFRELEILTRGMLDKEQKNYYHLYPYLNEEKLALAISLADLIVSRAGAGVLFEIGALKKPVLILPLSHSAQNHQVKNALFFKKKNAGIIIEGENLKPNFLFGKIREILEKEELLKSLSEEISKLSKKEATENVSKIILENI